MTLPTQTLPMYIEDFIIRQYILQCRFSAMDFLYHKIIFRSDFLLPFY
jgi:hypothetical protein